MDAKICDRCGEFYVLKFKGQGAKNPGTIKASNIDDLSKFNKKKLDLCPKCYEGFLEFVNIVKKEGEADEC